MRKNLDPKKLQREAEALTDAASRHGEEIVTRASQLAEQGLDRASQLAEQGMEWAGPRAQKLWEDTVKVTAPKLEEAADKVRPYLDNVHDKVVDDYLPRIENAAREASKAAQKDGSLVERAQRAGDATRKSLAKPAPKKRRFGKFLGWTLLGTVAAGAGYLMWRRSQPLEDPWAEEYWADLDSAVEVPTNPAEAVQSDNVDQSVPAEDVPPAEAEDPAAFETKPEVEPEENK